MSGRLTLWGAGEILSTFFSRSGEAPAQFYLALITETAPTPYVSGSELDEPTVGSYARVAIPNEIVNWSNAGKLQTMSLASDVTFIPATADWGRVKYWALCSAPVEGNVYFCGSMEQSFKVLNGDTALVAAGDISITLGPFYTSEEE